MFRHTALLLLTSLLCCAPSTQGAKAEPTGTDLPDFQASRASEQAEFQLGRHFLRQLRGGTALREDPLLLNYLENLGYRLVFAGPAASQDLQVVLIPDRRINAFAVPGGVIGVNEGLLLHADTEAELAAVLAHELGHITQHHYARAMENSGQGTLLYLGALLASIALASVNSDAGMALGLSTQAAMAQQQLAHSRQHEREADRVGMQTLAAAGFEPEAMPSFFSKMDKQARQVGLMPDFLLTHPITQERIADSTLRARHYKGAGASDSLDYQLIRARLLAIMNPSDSQRIAALRHRLADMPSDQVARLGLALALMNHDEFDAARNEIATLLKKNPAKIDYLITAADIEIAAGQPGQALKVLEPGLQVSPDSVPLRLYAARAATLDQQARRSLAWLEPLSFTRPADPLVWRALMEAYQQLKDAPGVLRARAEYLFLLDQGDKALKDLEQAAEMARGNYPLAARIDQRRHEIQDTLAQDKKN